MKNRYITIFTVLLMMYSCSSLDDLNVNPTKSTDINPSLLITSAQFGPSQGFYEARNFLAFPGGFMNNWTGAWSVVTYGGYGKMYPTFSERPWRYFYQQIIKPIMIAVERTEGNPDMVNVSSAARLVRVQNFLRLTDYYGDIPYSDVFRVYRDGTVNPRYDTQETIYMDMLKECREAVNAFDPSKPSLDYDLYFDGDVVKWKRFGASLWLRIAMRLVRIMPDLAKTEAEAAIAAGLMQSNGDTALVKHDDVRSESGPGNGYSHTFIQDLREGTSPFQVTAEMVAAMEGDPRLTYLGRNYLADGTDVTERLYAYVKKYVGQPAQNFAYSNRLPELTLPDGTVAGRYTQYLTASSWVTAADAPFVHLSYAETEFLRAEAALNGWNVEGTAEEHYRKGLVAAVKQWEVYGVDDIPGDAALEAFADSNVEAFMKDKGRIEILEEINKQLWILHTLDPVEGWSNLRRTEMPSEYTKFKNLSPSTNESGGKRPNRMPYPLDEQKKNPSGYSAAIERMGGKDDWTHPLWWQGGEYK